jgi:hypothetical protein
MPDIRRDFRGQTIITTFETTPALAFDLIEALQAAFAECISKQPGFWARRSTSTTPDAGVQLLPVGEPRGLSGDAAHAGDAGAEPGDQRAVPGVRAGDV